MNKLSNERLFMSRQPQLNNDSDESRHLQHTGSNDPVPRQQWSDDEAVRIRPWNHADKRVQHRPAYVRSASPRCNGHSTQHHQSTKDSCTTTTTTIINNNQAPGATVSHRKSFDNRDDTSFVFHSADHSEHTLSMLGAMRRERTLCDVVLCVGRNTNIHAHQALLGCHSSILMKIFQRVHTNERMPQGLLVDTPSYVQRQLYCKFNDSIDVEAFEFLVDYVYSGKLPICEKNVESIYALANTLRMFTVTAACKQYLMDRVNPWNCLGILRIADCPEMKELALAELQNNFDEIAKSKDFEKLPKFNVEIRGRPVLFCGRSHVAACVLRYLRSHWLAHAGYTSSSSSGKSRGGMRCGSIGGHASGNLASMASATHRIYIEGRDTNGNSEWPTDNETEGSTINGPHFVEHDVTEIDFLNERSSCSSPTASMKSGQPGSIGSNATNGNIEIFHVVKLGYRRICGIGRINTEVVAFSIVIKSIDPTMKNDDVHWMLEPDPYMSDLSSEQNTAYKAKADKFRQDMLLRSFCDVDLSLMSSPRAGFALMAMGDKLIAAGGFHSGACLTNVEIIDLKGARRWTKLPSLRSKRSRCSAGIFEGKLTIFGGSNGGNYLYDALSLCEETMTWYPVSSFQIPISQSAIVSHEEHGVFSVCGSKDGEASDSCMRYNKVTMSWLPVSNLICKRLTPMVVWYEDLMYVFGGSERWKCIRTSESYSPASNRWLRQPDMPDSKRGAGIAIYNDKIYIVGGTDGLITLSSVDIYNPKTMQWERGPDLNTPRSTPGVAVSGGILYVVGGFDGFSFDRSGEYLDVEANKWRRLTREKLPNLVSAVSSTDSNNPTTIVATSSGPNNNNNNNNDNNEQVTLEQSSTGQQQTATSSKELDNSNNNNAALGPEPVQASVVLMMTTTAAGRKSLSFDVGDPLGTNKPTNDSISPPEKFTITCGNPTIHCSHSTDLNDSSDDMSSDQTVDDKPIRSSFEH